MRRDWLMIVLVLLAAAAVASSSLALRSAAAHSHDICVQVQALKAQIVQTLERSKKGLPANAYFKAHPKELARALKDADQSIRDFQPTKC